MALTSALKIFSAAVVFGFTILCARLIGAKSFGDYATALASASLAGAIASLGLPQLVEREVAAARASSDFTTLRALLQTSAGITLILFATFVVAASTATPYIALIVALSALIGVSTICASTFIGLERITPSEVVMNGVRPLLLFPLLGFTLLVVGRSANAAVLAQVLSYLAIVLIYVSMIVRKHWDRLKTLGRDKTRLTDEDSKRVAFAAGTFIGMQLLVNAGAQLDILILSAMMPAEAVGHYYAAARAAVVVSFAYGASATIVMPILSRCVTAGSTRELSETVRLYAKVGAAFTIASAALFVAAAGPYLSLYGSGFESARSSLIVLVSVYIFMSILGPSQALLIATGRERYVLYAIVPALLSNVIFTVGLIPMIGMLGAAVGTVVQFTVYSTLLYGYCRRKVRIRTDLFA